MRPDHYPSHLPTAEIDRRERIAEDICAALTMAESVELIAERFSARTAPDSPVVSAVDEFAAAVETAAGELAASLRRVEGGRYQYVEAQRSPEAVGIAAQADLGKLLTGGR